MLETQVYKIGQILFIRWFSSSSNTVAADIKIMKRVEIEVELYGQLLPLHLTKIRNLTPPSPDNSECYEPDTLDRGAPGVGTLTGNNIVRKKIVTLLPVPKHHSRYHCANGSSCVLECADWYFRCDTKVNSSSVLPAIGSDLDVARTLACQVWPSPKNGKTQINIDVQKCVVATFVVLAAGSAFPLTYVTPTGGQQHQQLAAGPALASYHVPAQSNYQTPQSQSPSYQEQPSPAAYSSQSSPIAYRPQQSNLPSYQPQPSLPQSYQAQTQSEGGPQYVLRAGQGAPAKTGQQLLPASPEDFDRKVVPPRDCQSTARGGKVSEIDLIQFTYTCTDHFLYSLLPTLPPFRSLRVAQWNNWRQTAYSTGIAKLFKHACTTDCIGAKRHTLTSWSTAAEHTTLISNPQYQFSFDVKDDQFTNYQNRKEQRKGDKISGSYSVVDSDGFIRTVKYTADPLESRQHGDTKADARKNVPLNIIYLGIVTAYFSDRNDMNDARQCIKALIVSCVLKKTCVTVSHGFKAEVTREPTDIVVKFPTPPPTLPKNPQYTQEARQQAVHQYLQGTQQELSPAQVYSSLAHQSPQQLGEPRPVPGAVPLPNLQKQYSQRTSEPQEYIAQAPSANSVKVGANGYATQPTGGSICVGYSLYIVKGVEWLAITVELAERTPRFVTAPSNLYFQPQAFRGHANEQHPEIKDRVGPMPITDPIHRPILAQSAKDNRSFFMPIFYANNQNP
uniref:Uncharacterized protein n=1 Tax=Timema bartmani TaxID=61472 RepID=A0A7R9I531_9NEOP|nr:unnamed protein product [Timema bartmani]